MKVPVCIGTLDSQWPILRIGFRVGQNGVAKAETSASMGLGVASLMEQFHPIEPQWSSFTRLNRNGAVSPD
jgi:hypothetical protein